jgi:hypothetical protein
MFIFTAVSVIPTGFLISGEKQVVVEGILIDSKCYAQDNKNTTNDHDTAAGTMVNCGTTCAAMGIPVGFLEGGKIEGDVYILLVPSRTLADHVGKWARVTGKNVFGGSLMVDKLEVKDKSGNYRNVEIVTMM